MKQVGSGEGEMGDEGPVAMGVDAAAAEQSMDEARRLVIAAERERIALDLHDRLIRSLFDASVDLDVAATLADGDVRERIMRAIGQIDQAMREVRAAVFEPAPTGEDPGSERTDGH